MTISPLLSHDPHHHAPAPDWLAVDALSDSAAALRAARVSSVLVTRPRLASLEALDARCATLPEFELSRAVLSDTDDLSALLARLPDGPERALLHEDMLALLRAFAAASGDLTVHIGLALTRQDECSRFHHDSLRLRLLCTYVGPGTEWLPAHAVHAPALGSPHHHSQDVIADPEAICRARTHHVLWMKGNRFGFGHAACVHRSPPIRHLGLSRLVLRISTPDSPLPLQHH